MIYNNYNELYELFIVNTQYTYIKLLQNYKIILINIVKY